MWTDIFERNTLILASQSPRRRELLAGLGIRFTLAAPFECDEIYPASLPPTEVAEYLSALKSRSFPHPLSPTDLLLTADTVVVCEGTVLGKPHSEAEARQMLTQLSGREHTVVTGITLRSATHSESLSVQTRVWFARLTPDEIDHYVSTFRPMDKAGSYGIQEWIGYIGIERIEGSFYNVMGLPTQRLYTLLRNFSQKYLDK